MVNKTYKPCDLVIYGGLGDLATRKLIISLFRLEKAGLLESDSKIIAVDRLDKTKDEFVDIAHNSLEKFLNDEIDPQLWEKFRQRLNYLKIDLMQQAEYSKLKTAISPDTHVLVNYLAVSPVLFKHICHGLDKAGLLNDESRIVMEKPIGHDLKSCIEINDAVSEVFKEEQIFRIDHYLGKETVLNLLALRFANSIFTTNWDHNSVDSIQITVAEAVGIEGRWDYFDHTGQLRDMLQNHLLQILTFVTMEPPVDLEATSIRSEKIKVLKAMRPINANNVEQVTVRGQYAKGFQGADPVPGYLEEEGANPDSSTETFVALRVDIDNWRWAGVPVYLRTGKRMNYKRTEIVINFKPLPHNIFPHSFKNLPANKLIIHLQPNEGIEIEILNKVPGIDGDIKLQKTKLDLSFSEAFKASQIFGGYEKLILEALRGNPTLFLSREEIEQAWAWVDSIQIAWKNQNIHPSPYPAGTWGPITSDSLLARDGRAWEA